MELTFEQIDGYWISEFEVNADFNLHIERDTEGRLDIYQRTAGGRYEYINDIGYLEKRLVYDYDFSALVYPKFIKIKSKVKPLICTITTDGEINELKYQEKTLEITSNGTTKVKADTGYNGLASVNVKVNVPTEGGGSGGNEEVGILYFNISNIPQDALLQVLIISFLVNIGNQIMPTPLFTYSAEGFIDNLIDAKNIAVVYGYSSQGRQVTESEVKSLLESLGAILITEEEFYHIPSVEV